MCKTDYGGGGGGGKNVPKIDYVICERPWLISISKSNFTKNQPKLYYTGAAARTIIEC